MDERLGRLRTAASTAVLSKGLNLLVTVIAIFVMARHLGAEAYGLWVTLTGSVSLFMLLDIGIASTLTNLLSEAYAAEDKQLAAEHFSNAFWMVLAVTCVIGLAGFAAGSLIDWPAVLHVQQHPLRSATTQSVAVCFGGILLSLPSGLATRVLAGYQELYIANPVSGRGSRLGLLCRLTALAAHRSLPWLVGAYTAPMMLVNALCLAWLILKHKPWILPALRHVTRPRAFSLFRSGGNFFLIQVAGLVVFNSDNLIIAHFRGAAEVTPYSTAWRLVGYLMVLQGVMMPALWPALSEAHARGDLPWMRAAYARLRRYTLLVVAVGGTAIALFGRAIIRHWAGPSAVPSQALLGWMCVGMAICSITMNQSTLLGAVSRVKRQAIASSLAALLNLVLSIFWVQRFGSLGVLLATVTSYVLFILCVQTIEVKKVLRGDLLRVPTLMGGVNAEG